MTQGDMESGPLANKGHDPRGGKAAHRVRPSWAGVAKDRAPRASSTLLAQDSEVQEPRASCCYTPLHVYWSPIRWRGEWWGLGV